MPLRNCFYVNTRRCVRLYLLTAMDSSYVIRIKTLQKRKQNYNNNNNNRKTTRNDHRRIVLTVPFGFARWLFKSRAGYGTEEISTVIAGPVIGRVYRETIESVKILLYRVVCFGCERFIRHVVVCDVRTTRVLRLWGGGGKISHPCRYSKRKEKNRPNTQRRRFRKRK